MRDPDEYPAHFTARDRRDYDHGPVEDHPAEWEWCGPDDFWWWPGPD